MFKKSTGTILLINALVILLITISCSHRNETKDGQKLQFAKTDYNFVSRESGGYEIIPFGSGGQVKMLYDRRQRPQAIFINSKVQIVYNGGAKKDADERSGTFPFAISFDPKTMTFSSPVQLGYEGSRDHHHCPVIWADNNDRLHVLYGNHSSAGTHLISNKKASIGSNAEDWSVAPEIRHSLSYPTVYNIYGNKKLIYFRTGEHRSAWSYLISADEGNTWMAPANHVVDLNMGGETQPENNQPGIEEWSSYQTCLPSRDGKSLHVVFCYYDDNKRKMPEKFYNPRYKTKSNLNIKYNLYYIKINLQSHEVKNFEGEKVNTPIDMENANTKCMIWDTQWRGAGVPPDIVLDEAGNPAFLHVLSEDTPETFNYYYVKYDKNEWRKTVIAPSNHRWNSNYVKLDKEGVLHAYLIVSKRKSKRPEGKMDSYGGGNIEEWHSNDNGNTWTKIQELAPKDPEFEGWNYNNVQPVKDRMGNTIDGMLIFYGWKDSEVPAAKAFLWHEDGRGH
jgi:hypothetical protein